MTMFDTIQRKNGKGDTAEPDGETLAKQALAIVARLTETVQRDEKATEALCEAAERIAQAAQAVMGLHAIAPTVNVEPPEVHVEAPSVTVEPQDVTMPAPVVQMLDSKPKGATATPYRDANNYITKVEWVFHY